MPGPIQIDVGHAAKLARLALSEEETTIFQEQLERVLEYAKKLQELDTRDEQPAAHAVPVSNVFREDELRSSLTAEEALRNAPRQANGLFFVPKVVE
jgi:aspartyl-tRNA(Asn)/glutamyl-tRNA(Gln) amidotransferase subunit C